MQQQGCSDEEVNAAKAEIADLLAYQQEQIDACYSQSSRWASPSSTLAQVVYSSVPGWCAYSQYCVPDWYYDNGCYVGRLQPPATAAITPCPVYNAWHDNGSHFNYGITTGSPSSTEASTRRIAKRTGIITTTGTAVCRMTASHVRLQPLP